MAEQDAGTEPKTPRPASARARPLPVTELDFRELVEHASDLVYTHDLLGRFTWCNAAVERVLGWTAEEFGGLTLEQVIAPDFLQAAHKVMYERLTERLTPYALVVHHKDGR